MNRLERTGFVAINQNQRPRGEVQKQPNYRFPKEALAYAIGAAACATLIAIVVIYPIATAYRVLSTAGLFGGCLAASAKASRAYQQNRAEAELEFAIRIKTTYPANAQKWLEKAALKRCYPLARLELAEMTSDRSLKLFLIKLLEMRSTFSSFNRIEKERVIKIKMSLESRAS